jgi:hypothetical protein
MQRFNVFGAECTYSSDRPAGDSTSSARTEHLRVAGFAPWADTPARLTILSTYQRPAIAVFPDSNKQGVRSGGESDNLIAERTSAVPYWHGEA